MSTTNSVYTPLQAMQISMSAPVESDRFDEFRVIAAGVYKPTAIEKQKQYSKVQQRLQTYVKRTFFHFCNGDLFNRKRLNLNHPLLEDIAQSRQSLFRIRNRVLRNIQDASPNLAFYLRLAANIYNTTIILWDGQNPLMNCHYGRIFAPEAYTTKANKPDYEENCAKKLQDLEIPIFGIYQDHSLDLRLVKYEEWIRNNGSGPYVLSPNQQLRDEIQDLIGQGSLEIMSMYVEED